MATYLTAEEEIRRRIKREGRITFAEFMELALFWPWGGYYGGSRLIGTERDFYTSPGAHPVFGALLAIQLLQMWRLLGEPRPFWVVDVGAGGGLLCHDLVSYTLYLPEQFHQALRYLCIERRTVHGVERHLPDSAGYLVDRLAVQGLPLRGVKGCFLLNELVDSFPVHRVEMKEGRLREVYLTLEGEKFKEELDEPSTKDLEGRLKMVGVQLPKGYSTEINLAMETWLSGVAQALQLGYLLTIDYGRQASELYSEARSRGTLTCFYRHIQTDNPYIHIGDQDITAQVDFTTLINQGKGYGLKPLGYLAQGQFLANLGIRRMMEGLPSLGLKQHALDANRMAMLDLIRPGGLGEFKVLVQGKGTPDLPLWGLESDEELERLLAKLPTPLLTPLHMPLLQGRYPHLAVDWGNLGLEGKEVPSKAEGSR